MNAKKLEALVESFIGANLKGSIKTKSAFLEAVPAVIMLQKAASDAYGWARKVSDMTKAVSVAAAAYAIDHPEHMTEPLSEERSGVKTGYVEIDGKVYHLAVSKGDPRRKDGGNMTSDFAEKLPTGWQKTEVTTVLDKAYLLTLTDSELGKKGLYIPLKTTWRVGDAP